MPFQSAQSRLPCRRPPYFSQSWVLNVVPPKCRKSSTVQAAVQLGTSSGEDLGFRIELLADCQGTDDETAQELAEKALESCPFARMASGNVDIKVIGVGEHGTSKGKFKIAMGGFI